MIVLFNYVDILIFTKDNGRSMGVGKSIHITLLEQGGANKVPE